MSKEPNFLSPLVDSLFNTTVGSLNGSLRALKSLVGYKSEKELEELKKASESLILARQKEEEEDRLRELEAQNKVTINRKTLDFNQLFFNCGLKNKNQDMPILKEHRMYETVDIFSFNLPVGLTVSVIKDKIEHIADFFQTKQMNINIQKKNGLMEIILTKNNLFGRIFDYKHLSLSSDGLEIPVGYFINEEHLEKILVINMAKDSIPHGFIGSTTGGGKSNFIRIMLLSWIMNKPVKDLELYLMDGKGGTDYVSFLKAPHVYKNTCFKDVDDIIGLLEEANQEILRRNQIFISKEANNFNEYISLGYEMPRRVIVFDEYAMYHGSKRYGEIQSKVGKICATGRSAGVHIIVATQDGRKEILDSMIKYNMPLKIGFKCVNKQHSKNICGYEGLETINQIGVGRVYGLPRETEDIETEHIQFKAMKAPSSHDIKKMIKEKYKDFKKEDVYKEDYFFGEECE